MIEIGDRVEVGDYFNYLTGKVIHKYNKGDLPQLVITVDNRSRLRLYIGDSIYYSNPTEISVWEGYCKKI